MRLWGSGLRLSGASSPCQRLLDLARFAGSLRYAPPSLLGSGSSRLFRAPERHRSLTYHCTPHASRQSKAEGELTMRLQARVPKDPRPVCRRSQGTPGFDGVSATHPHAHPASRSLCITCGRTPVRGHLSVSGHMSKAELPRIAERAGPLPVSGSGTTWHSWHTWHSFEGIAGFLHGTQAAWSWKHGYRRAWSAHPHPALSESPATHLQSRGRRVYLS